MCLKFFDTEKEREIDLGVTWPYKKLAPYECLLADSFADLGIAEGDAVRVHMNWTSFWNNMRN